VNPKESNPPAASAGGSSSPPWGPFPEGSTVIRLETFCGKTWSAAPYRLVQDDGKVMTMAYWAGIQSLAPSTWADWRRTGNDALRRQTVPDLKAGTWKLARWTWRDSNLLIRMSSDDYFSISRFYRSDGELTGWYVNFERPYRRTSVGVETFDLLIDLVVAADLSSYRWKDEDEYEHGRRLGLIADSTYKCVEAAREKVVELIKARSGPFTERSPMFWDPAWPLPALPGGLLE
jgi:protein associated with RNAse G/E